MQKLPADNSVFMKMCNFSEKLGRKMCIFIKKLGRKMCLDGKLIKY